VGRAERSGAQRQNNHYPFHGFIVLSTPDYLLLEPPDEPPEEPPEDLDDPVDEPPNDPPEDPPNDPLPDDLGDDSLDGGRENVGALLDDELELSVRPELELRPELEEVP